MGLLFFQIINSFLHRVECRDSSFILKSFQLLQNVGVSKFLPTLREGNECLLQFLICGFVVSFQRQLWAMLWRSRIYHLLCLLLFKYILNITNLQGTVQYKIFKFWLYFAFIFLFFTCGIYSGLLLCQKGQIRCFCSVVYKLYIASYLEIPFLSILIRYINNCSLLRISQYPSKLQVQSAYLNLLIWL